VRRQALPHAPRDPRARARPEGLGDRPARGLHAGCDGVPRIQGGVRGDRVRDGPAPRRVEGPGSRTKPPAGPVPRMRQGVRTGSVPRPPDGRPRALDDVPTVHGSTAGRFSRATSKTPPTRLRMTCSTAHVIRSGRGFTPSEVRYAAMRRSTSRRSVGFARSTRAIRGGDIPRAYKDYSAPAFAAGNRGTTARF